MKPIFADDRKRITLPPPAKPRSGWVTVVATETEIRLIAYKRRRASNRQANGPLETARDLAVTYLLDTQTFLWAATGAKELPETIRKRLEEHRRVLGVPAVAVAELAMKDRIGRLEPHRKGALKFPVPFRQWIGAALSATRYEIVPLTAEISAEAFDLPGDFHKDPFDMMIVATARLFNLELVTSDEDIRDYPHVKRLYFPPQRL